MRDEVLSAAARRDLFLSPEALEIMDSNGYSMEFVNTVLNALANNTIFVTKKDVLDFLNGDSHVMEPLRTEPQKNRKRNNDIKIVPGSDITGNSTCEGTIADFVTYFRNRFAALKKIVSKRRDFGPAVSIERAMMLDRDVNIIGMVYDVRTTRNGHTMITLEDETGSCPVLISKDSPLIDTLLVTDEVIGVSGRKTRSNLFIAENIVHPDVPKNNRWIPSDSSASVAIISDIHVGSKEFLEPQWNKMVRWLKTNSAEEEIDYIIMPGDVVDGIGAYPNQENDLKILDIYQQYETLAEYLKEIPDDIQIVMHPGNHDACRLAEPQPALSEKFAKGFDSNITMTGNPINIRIEDRLIVSYHGKSIDDWISNVRGMSYDDPVRVMDAMIERRHMAPMYGQRNALAPEKKDYLVIEEVPDIFVSGHVHGIGYKQHNGVRMINASTWQSQTDYQKMHNFNPKPGVVPVVHLGNGRVRMMDFMDVRSLRTGTRARRKPPAGSIFPQRYSLRTLGLNRYANSTRPKANRIIP